MCFNSVSLPKLFQIATWMNRTTTAPPIANQHVQTQNLSVLECAPRLANVTTATYAMLRVEVASLLTTAEFPIVYDLFQ